LLAAVREGNTVVNRLTRLGRNTVHTIQLVEEFNWWGLHLRTLDLGIDSRTPAGKMVIGVFFNFYQYERENNREKSLAGIEFAKQQGKHLGRPARRNAEKVAKVAKALERGLSVAESFTLTGSSRANVKRYRQKSLLPA
jgi:DNA invertase Pin-like site-specific DNA recombinase